MYPLPKALCFWGGETPSLASLALAPPPGGQGAGLGRGLGLPVCGSPPAHPCLPPQSWAAQRLFALLLSCAAGAGEMLLYWGCREAVYWEGGGRK